MDDPTSISKFSKEFVVAERCVKDYLEYLTLLDLKKDKRKKERHIIQQQIQGFTQEEGSPLCTSENEEEYLSSDDESVQTDYVLAEIGSSSEDDDEEGDDIQITVTTTRSGRRATRYLL